MGKDFKTNMLYKLILGVIIILLFGFGLTSATYNKKADGVIGCINGVNFEIKQPHDKHGCILGGKYPLNWRKITFQEKHLKTYKELGATYTEALDLAMIKSLECGDVKGNCDNHNDVGPFQINRATHPVPARKSLGLIRGKKWGELFTYQAKWTLDRTRSYDRLCGHYDTRKKSKCRAMVHNGNTKWGFPKGYNIMAKYDNGTNKCETLLYKTACWQQRVYYSVLGWEERKFIKQYIKDNLTKYENN